MDELLDVVQAVQINFKCVGSVYFFVLSQVNRFLDETTEIRNRRLILSLNADVHVSAQLRKLHLFLSGAVSPAIGVR